MSTLKVVLGIARLIAGLLIERGAELLRMALGKSEGET